MALSVVSEGNLGKTWLLPRRNFLLAFSAFTHYNALAECMLTLRSDHARQHE